MPRTRSNAVVGAVKSGDILIKHNEKWTGTGIMIQVGQLASKGKSKFTHSALASSSVTVIEMSGSGLHESNLLTDNAAHSYDLFRCKLPKLAEGAAEVGKMMMGFVGEGSGDIKYSTKGALKSLLRTSPLGNTDRINSILDNLLAGGTENYFCSGHTVLCYVVAMEQSNIHAQSSFPVEKMRMVFGSENTGYNPSYLHNHLKKSTNFNFIGTIKGAQLVG